MHHFYEKEYLKEKNIHKYFLYITIETKKNSESTQTT